MRNFTDVDCQSVISNNDILDNGSDTLLCPLLIKHFVYPLSNKRDPTLFVKIQKQSVQMLLDTGAHVSVLPQTLAQKFVDIVDDQNNKGRLVRAFGGQEIQFGGPIYLQVDICGVAITHPFHYVNADVPPIGGYDLLREAKLIIDADASKVWSKISTEATKVTWTNDQNTSVTSSFLNEIEQFQPIIAHEQCVTDPPASDFSCDIETNNDNVINSGANGYDCTPCVNDDTQYPSRSHCSVTQDTSSQFRTHVETDEGHKESILNPAAPSFLPVRPSTIADNLDQTDKFPEHINLLYEATVNNTTLSHEVDLQFKEMLHKHKATFASCSTDIGFCSLLEHGIDTGQSPPIKQSPRRPPLSAGDAETDIINDMLEAGVIEPSNSEWASLVCLVKKSDGTYRFCIDYRRVNAVSRKDAFPTPDLKDALDNLRGARWFATLDLLSEYWQLGMSERAKERSAFCTRRGLYQFRRMPFGLCGAPATFCRLMSMVLRDHIGVICLCYLDDVIVFGKTQAELLVRLDQILTRLAECGLKVKPSKCVLFRTWLQLQGCNHSQIKLRPFETGQHRVVSVMSEHLLA